MSVTRSTVGVAAAAALLTVSAAADAAPVRAAGSVPQVSASLAAQTARIGTRQTRAVKADERLLGAPLFLLLGAVVVTTVTLIVVKKNDSNG